MSNILPIRQSEETLQNQIVDYLTWEGFEVFQFGQCRAHRKLGGIIPEGWVDLLIIRNGQVVFLELKLPGKKATPKQEALHARIRLAGGRVAVVHRVEEVQEALRLEGFELRGELQ